MLSFVHLMVSWKMKMRSSVKKKFTKASNSNVGGMKPQFDLIDAKKAFNSGHVNEAFNICRKLLLVNPLDPRALHLMGLIAMKKGEFDLSHSLISKAIAQQPAVSQFYLNRSVAATKLGRLDEALSDANTASILKAKYQKAIDQKAKILVLQKKDEEALACFEALIKISPNNGMGYSSRAKYFVSTGRLDCAERDILAALKINPHSHLLLNDLGEVQAQLGKTQKALQSFTSAISKKNDFHEAHLNKGDILQSLERYHEAVEAYKVAVDIDPFSKAALNNLGNALNNLGQFDDAIKIFDLCLSLKSDFAPTLSNKATSLQKLGRVEEAIESFKVALKVDPFAPKVLYNMANCLAEVDPEEALITYNRAIELDPNYSEALNNKGNLLKALGRFSEALDAFDHVIKINPDPAEPYYNRGNLLQDLKRYEESIASYRIAIDKRPDYPNAQWNLSLLLLRLGQFEEGWQRYEWRWQRPEFTSPKRGFSPPLWLGKECLKNKTLLVHSEQGLGDTIQFSRFVKKLEKIAGDIILEVPPTLFQLLNIYDDNVRLIKKGERLPDFDYHCPMLSLPLALGTHLNNIPYPEGYLLADKEKTSYWANILGPKKRPRVGIVWSGSEGHKDDTFRSIGLHKFLEIMQLDIDLISLQKEVRTDDKNFMLSNSSIKHFGDQLADFADTAALCEAMDLVISVDTSVAHLSGALGKKTWLLVADKSDFRWMEERLDTPWYKSVALYRQDISADWGSVFSDLLLDLRKII